MLALCPFLGFLQILQVVLEWLSPWARKLVNPCLSGMRRRPVTWLSVSTAQICPLCLQPFLLAPSVDIALPSIPPSEHEEFTLIINDLQDTFTSLTSSSPHYNLVNQKHNPYSASAKYRINVLTSLHAFSLLILPTTQPDEVASIIKSAVPKRKIRI